MTQPPSFRSERPTKRHLMLAVAAAIMVLCAPFGADALRAADEADEVAMPFPTPHYQPAPDDPAWLTASVQLHGHLGPWAVAGVRLGSAARRAVGADGYFDVAVTCIGPFDAPPNSCFLDGLQLGTGATLGKRNLTWVKGEEIAVEVENTRTGAKAVVRPSDELLSLLFGMSGKVAAAKKHDGHAAAVDQHEHSDAHGHHHDAETAVVESLARQVARLPDAHLLIETTTATESDGPGHGN
jgi:formylmethanofuran dehydrogenase subunit E